jgi:hypothetical protein
MLLRELVKIAGEEHVEPLRAAGPEENQAMQRLCERAGFKLRRNGSATGFEATLTS